MTDNFDPIFAENGGVDSDITYYTYANKGLFDEPLRYKCFNKAIQIGQERTNDLLNNGPRPGMPGASFESVLTDIYPGETSPLGSSSVVDTAKPTADYLSYAIAKIGNYRKIIACDNATSLSLDIINIDTMSFDGAQSIPSTSLPDLGTEEWKPIGITCDNSNAYVVWFQSNVADASYSDYYLQAYELSSWTVVNGWPSTGLFLFDSGGTVARVDIITANSSLLAIGNWVSGDSVLFVEKADGTISSSGDGDGASGAKNICSNGTYIFTSDGFSVSISNPAVGCGGTNWPVTVSDSNDVACIGDLVVYTADFTNIAYIAHAENALIGTVASTNDNVCKKLSRITSNGLYFYAIGIREVDTVDRYCMFKIDPYVAVNKDGSTSEVLDHSIITPIGLIDTASYAPETSPESPPIIYDSESMWVVQEKSNNCEFIRVTRINLR